MTDWISPRQLVEDWRVLGEGVYTYFRAGSFAAGAGLVHAISELAGSGEPDALERPLG